MEPLALLRARAELQERAGDDFDAIAYLRAQGVPLTSLGGYFGAYALTGIVDCGASRFDWSDDTGEASPGFVLEALGEDGEHVDDLVAWPVDRPQHVMSMFGRCALVGVAEALAPSTYAMGWPLDVHRSPLAWMRAGCKGCAIILPTLAASVLLDIPHAIAGRDDAHTVELIALARSALPALNTAKFLTAFEPRRAA